VNTTTQKSTDQDNSQYSYFGLQSGWGVTKHFGGIRVTQQLAELCHIQSTSYVLEVGCGVGFTSSFLAQKYGCRIMGIDLSAQMVEWAQKRAARKDLQALCEFRVADAQQLPFEDGTFDAMLCESVTAFVPDKAKALGEYCRVVKPGGYVALNEGTWVKGNPPADFLQFVQRTMDNVHFLDAQGWRDLLVDAGLQDISAQSYPLTMIQQRRDETQGLDFEDWRHRFSSFGQFISQYLRDSDFRSYAKTLIPSRRVISDLFNYLGYGLYIGKVPM
jgi:ubiquinone/menaquinone biosynthesis C-methylase UbiE